MKYRLRDCEVDATHSDSPGTVTVENTGLGGVTVRLSGMADAQTATDNNGQYAFTGLRSGTYSVEISGFDMDEVGFGSVESAATVGVGESKIISFDGTYLRTAGIMGQVSVEGVGLAGVTVTMAGEGEDMTDVTDAGGLYGFSKLKAGDYSVAISGYDTDDHEFATTSKSVAIALGETANVPFEGTLLRTSGISGRVSVEGMGLDGVEVVLAGAAEATAMTSGGGQYAFAGLAEGTYVVSMANPDADAYNFEETSHTVVLGDAVSEIRNFDGTHTRTASISGVLFIDEVMQDKMLTTGEPSITAALAPLVQHGLLDPAMLAGLLTHAKVMLRGPDLNTMTPVDINPADGTFTTGASLQAGSYQVELPANNELVAAALAAAGVAFVGESSVVTVAAGGMETVNFPFRITMQTIGVGAVMGMADEEIPVDRARVEGVTLALFPTAQDAEDGTNLLGMGAKTGETGMAAFQFARADDTSPGSDDSDNLVFVKVVDAGHGDLVVSDNDVIEIEYPGVARVHSAPAHVRLLNVGVNLQFWVKSNETARGGNMGLEGWATEYCMPTADDDCTGEDAAFTAMMDDDDEAVLTDEEGKGTLSFMADPAALPAMVYVRAADDQDDDQDYDEAYEQSDALMHSHDGLILPANNDPAENMDLDLGPVRITYTTQSVYVGLHRELDDRTGYTDYIGVGAGDDRVGDNADEKIDVSLMVADSRGRLRILEYDDDADPETDDAEATTTFGGVVRFENVPADLNITVVADAPSGMVIVPDDRDTREIDAHGDALDDYPDGIMAGAFGDGSGGRPDVWICPLQRQEDAEKNCSTFAYKWADGSISGAVTGLRKGDEEVVVRLEPVNSNDDYAADLEDDVEVDYSASGVSYEFTGVADGNYQVILEEVAGKWPADTVDVDEIMHDEDDDNDEFAPDNRTVKDLSATDLRGVIKGIIANDANDSESLNGDEQRSGVVVNLHAASAPIRRGPNAGRRSAGAAVTDENGDPVTDETDEDGVYSFSGLTVGSSYFVKPEGTDLYAVVRNGNTRVANEKAADVVTQGLVVASDDPLDDIEVGVPSWESHTSTATVPGSADFVLLYKNGEVEGTVMDPSVRAAHEHATVELHRCMESDAMFTDGAVTTEATGCTKFASGGMSEWPVDDDGDWLAEDLMEGVYEVRVDLPAGYQHVDMAGSVENGVSGQVAELAGGRASGDTDIFYIKDRNADAGTASYTSEVKMGTTPIPTTAGWVPHSTSSVSLKLTTTDADSENATFVIAGTTNEFGADGTSWVLAPGDNDLVVAVTSEDGYTTADTGVNETDRVHLDRDTRLDGIRIEWQGNSASLTRSQLERISGFLTDEGRQTARINYRGDGQAPTTAIVDLGEIEIDADGETITVEATSMSVDDDGADVGVTITTDPGTPAVGVVRVTILDAERSLNTRTYEFTIKEKT